MAKKILIEGMKCEHCVGHVKEALEGLSGVISVTVNLAGNYAVVEGAVDNEELKEAIEEEGYDVISIEE